MRSRYLILASVLGLAISVPSLAQTTYVAVLTGASEVPMNPSSATGNATVVLNAAQTQVSISCQFQNLLGTYTASHLHAPGPIGVNAAVIIGFVSPGAPWVFSNANHNGTLVNFLAAITPVQVGYLNSGQVYANVHSTVFPGGEIRGQMGAQPVPTSKSTWSRVKSLFR